jgi:hypothetical protein
VIERIQRLCTNLKCLGFAQFEILRERQVRD